VIVAIERSSLIQTSQVKRQTSSKFRARNSKANPDFSGRTDDNLSADGPAVNLGKPGETLAAQPSASPPGRARVSVLSRPNGQAVDKRST
jgi:hypothetical protein